MGFLKEFKEFAVKGNVMDMAVGVIIGGAFGKIVTSVVNDIIMPPIGLLIGGVDFTDLKLTLKKAVVEAGTEIAPAVTWNYGAFIQQVVDFTILAFCVFMMVKIMNQLIKKREEAPAPAPAPAPEPEPSAEEKLLMEIRDLLKEQK
jgi:large conductance mechanosensitive channel